MATMTVAPSVNSKSETDIPQWKKDLIAKLRNQNKKNEERLWIDHHHSLPAGHPHPRTDLVCPKSAAENGFRDKDSPQSSDSEDLHYGPGIVNRLRNKYLSLALRESTARPTILRKATSLEHLLDDEGDAEEGAEEMAEGDAKRDAMPATIRAFSRRAGGHDGGGNQRYRSSGRRQEMKRARSVEVILRATHREDDSGGANSSAIVNRTNNRQSLHEDLLALSSKRDDKDADLIENARPYKKPTAVENGNEEQSDGKYNNTNNKRINRPKRVPPLLNEKEKPPVDVVKHAKMIFEKRPETRTKKPQHTGDVAAKVKTFNSIIVETKLASIAPWRNVKVAKPVPNGEVAAKVDSFNDIIVKSKPAKPTINRQKPVLNDKYKSNTHGHHNHHHVRPVAKPVILSEETVKPKSLDLRSPKQEKKTAFGGLPSPIPDVSRVDINETNGEKNHARNSLSETPDLILTSSPIPKIASPTYRKRSTEHFLNTERSSLWHPEATNKYVSPTRSPTKPPPSPFNRDDDSNAIDDFKMISPISQDDITKSAATSVYNFVDVQVDQRHLPKKPSSTDDANSPPSATVNGSKIKMGVSAFEMEKNLKNAAANLEEFASDANGTAGARREEETARETRKNGVAKCEPQQEERPANETEKATCAVEKTDRDVSKPVQLRSASEKTTAVVLPKKPKPRQEEATSAVFNFTSRKDVPDYIANDTSRTPSRLVIPKPDEPGIKLLSEEFLSSFKEIQEVWEEDELIRSLEARPPSPCDVTFINDNVLIDGKSSFVRHSSKRIKLKISFVDDADIFEYPSETSLLLDESSPIGSAGSQVVGHTVPTLSGSSLATYTPKTTEDFQLGVTKSFQESVASQKKRTEDEEDGSQTDVFLEEIDKPVLFSSGSTSDILF